MQAKINAWQQCQIADVLAAFNGGAWGHASDSPNAGVIGTTSISATHKLTLSKVAWRQLPEKQLLKQVLQNGDLVMTKSNSLERVGTCAIFWQPVTDQRSYVAANFCQRLRFDHRKIDPEYGYYWIISPRPQSALKALATGTSSSLQNINGKKISSIPISFPDIKEQRRIVASIKERMERVEELEELRCRRATDLAALKLSLLFRERPGDVQWVPAGQFVEWVQSSETVEPNVTYSFAGMRSFGRGPFYSRALAGNEFAYTTVRRLKNRDFMYPKLMAWEGAFGMIPESLANHVVSPEFAVFRSKSEAFRMEVLDTYFRSPLCLRDVRAASTGSNKRRRRLHPREFLKLNVPMISEEDQETLAAAYKLDRQCTDTEAETCREVEALRSSILHRAFAGEV